MEALLDRCLEQVSPCATVPRPSWTSDSAYLIPSIPGSRQRKYKVNYLQGVRRRDKNE